MDDGMAIEVFYTGHDAFLELDLGGYADVAEDGAGQFGEEPLDEVQPRAVLRGEDQLEASGRPGREPGVRFF